MIEMSTIVRPRQRVTGPVDRFAGLIALIKIERVKDKGKRIKARGE
jgi:hypothetical protein